jgi:hypothetical protein
MAHALNAAFGDQLINPYALMDMHRILSSTYRHKRSQDMRAYGDNNRGLFGASIINYYLTAHDLGLQLSSCGRISRDTSVVEQLEAALLAAPTRQRDALVLATRNAAGIGHAITLRVKAGTEGTRQWWFIDSEHTPTAIPLSTCSPVQMGMLQGEVYALCSGHAYVDSTLTLADPRSAMERNAVIEIDNSPAPLRRQRVRREGMQQARVEPDV